MAEMSRSRGPNKEFGWLEGCPKEIRTSDVGIRPWRKDDWGSASLAYRPMGGASHSGPGIMGPGPPNTDTERFRGESLGGQFGKVKEPRLLLASAGCIRDFMLFID